MSYERIVCPRCKGEGWLEPIGPCSDGSYTTFRPCPRCDQRGEIVVKSIPKEKE